jgi:hypothetical protein
LPARPAPGSSQGPSAPGFGAAGSSSHDGHTFRTRRERREFEQGNAGHPVTEAPTTTAAATTAPAADDDRAHREADPFAALLGLSDPHAHHATQADVREGDARSDDSRRAPDAGRLHRVAPAEASTQTGRVRLHPEEVARATDSAPVPVVLPGPNTLSTGTETEAGAGEPANGQASAPSTRRATRAAAQTLGLRRRGKSKPASTKPGDARPPATRLGSNARPKTEPRARTKPAQKAESAGRRRSRLTKLISKATIMLSAIGLVATTAVPAYAQFETPTWVDPATGKTQTLAVGAVQTGALDRDDFAAHTISTALDSTTGSVVAPEVQALAQQLMTAVAQGRLTGSSPDHIFEIRYLAAGEAVQGCGIDFRVLQAIAFALTKFNTVGVSDINRHCTGQIEGAGTASAHYTDGGGHAVDFFRLNGHALTGGDSDSIKLIEDLDAVVPTNSTVGQVGCRSSLSLSHFKEIDDTCNHVHIDFLDAKAATLLG